MDPARGRERWLSFSRRHRTSFGEMTLDRATRWWPPVGVLAMLVLGWVVGKGSTTVDDWFVHDAHELAGEYPSWLLVVTDWWLLGAVVATCLAVALHRRQWRLAVVTLVSPFAAIEIGEAVKPLFDRHRGGALAYPSGHMTLVVVVMGMVVVAAGGRLWAVTIAVAVSLLAACGLGSTYHYFTDTIGAVLLATAILCIAARLAGRVPADRKRHVGDRLSTRPHDRWSTGQDPVRG